MQVRVTEDHFCIGTMMHPKGSIIETPEPVAAYMVRAGKGELVNDDDDNGYTRRDMQAQATPAPKKRRKRRTKAEMEEARAAGEA